jgi:hypothetical protein
MRDSAQPWAHIIEILSQAVDSVLSVKRLQISKPMFDHGNSYKHQCSDHFSGI